MWHPMMNLVNTTLPQRYGAFMGLYLNARFTPPCLLMIKDAKKIKNMSAFVWSQTAYGGKIIKKLTFLQNSLEMVLMLFGIEKRLNKICIPKFIKKNKSWFQDMY